MDIPVAISFETGSRGQPPFRIRHEQLEFLLRLQFPISQIARIANGSVREHSQKVNEDQWSITPGFKHQVGCLDP